MSSSSIAIGAFLLLGPIILVSCVAVGVFGFNPERAQAIRAAEAEGPVILEEIRRIHIRAPDRFRHDRLDRHPFYAAALVSSWCYSLCVFAGAPLTSNVAVLSTQTKMVMAGCFFIGCTLALLGSSMGMRVGKWTVLRGVRDNLTSSMLADDIRLPYTLGGAGMFAMGVSMAIYSVTSFHSTIGSLGGWLTAGLAVAATAITLMFYLRVQRYVRASTTLITEAVAQIERGDDATE